jgi:hypothetical protein
MAKKQKTKMVLFLIFLWKERENEIMKNTKNNFSNSKTHFSNFKNDTSNLKKNNVSKLSKNLEENIVTMKNHFGV